MVVYLSSPIEDTTSTNAKTATHCSSLKSKLIKNITKHTTSRIITLTDLT